jgi:polar amino acid transport system substrate-binding protein
MDASFPPFEYVNGEGDLVGFDVDLARAIADHLASEYGTGVEVHFAANLPYDGLYDALTAERIDVVISALYTDPARADGFVYSTPYFNAGQVLVTREGEALNGLGDLAGRTLAVELGSEGDVVAREQARRVSDLTVLPCQSAQEALNQVVNGQAHAALVDHLSALSAVGEGSSLQITGPPVTDEPYAVALHGDSHELLEAVNNALEELEENGTLDQLRQKWFRSGP